MSDEHSFVAEKKHIMIFRTKTGDFVVGTDDLESLGRASWFKEYLGIDMNEQIGTRRVARPSSPDDELKIVAEGVEKELKFAQPRPVPPVRRPQPSYMDVNPNQMTQELWDSLTEQQKQQWYVAWLPATS